MEENENQNSSGAQGDPYDPVKEFFVECCIVDFTHPPNDDTPGDLWAAYVNWCAENNILPVTRSKFKEKTNTYALNANLRLSVIGHQYNKTQTTVHLIHHNDADGVCAAAIAILALQNDPRRMLVYPADYNRPLNTAQIMPGDSVIIVDFSFKPPDMKEIEEAIEYNPAGIGDFRRIIWIDHHQTAARYGYDYEGLRDFTNKGLAGCELTWKYFFPDKPIPAAVALIGDYDSWRLDLSESKKFHEGIKLLCPTPHALPWARLLSNDLEMHQLVHAAGTMAEAYRNNYCERIRTNYGHSVIFAGHKAYAMNLYGFGSQAYAEMFDEYPLLIAYIHDGKKFMVSLYSKEIDCAAIAQELGGGGHKGAAGFTCTALPWAVKGLEKEAEDGTQQPEQ